MSVQRSNYDEGKRGAVRNTNSGLPVDDSGPGLRVGPTTPTTADRKSEACPPDVAIAVASALGVGVDVAVYVDVSLSQNKSRRESESRALSAASEASGELRSAATQQSSLLDELKNNRNREVLEQFKALKRKRHCGQWTVVGMTEDGRLIFHRVNCKTWSCSYCAPRKAKRYKHLIAQLAEREQLRRFLTLTLDPSIIEGDSVRHLRSVFNKFRLYLRRKFGCPIKYIAVLEFHKSGVAHLHVLVDRFIPQEWIKQSWSALGGGSIVFIKYVDVHRVSRYLSKYLTKELLLSAPERSRRVTTSRSLQLIPKKNTEALWVLLKTNIFFLYSRFWQTAVSVLLDEDGFLASFSCVRQLA